MILVWGKRSEKEPNAQNQSSPPLLSLGFSYGVYLYEIYPFGTFRQFLKIFADVCNNGPS